MQEYMNFASGIVRRSLSFPADKPDSFEAFRAMISFIFDISIPEQAADLPFEAEVESLVFDGIIASRTRCTPAILRRTPALITRSASDDIAIGTYETGVFDMVFEDRRLTVEPGELLVQDLSKPLEISAQAMSNIALLIPRQRLHAWSGLLFDVHGLVIPKGAIQALLVGYMRSLFLHASDMQAGEAAAVAEMTVNLVGTCLQQSRHRSADTQIGTATLSRIKAAIEDQLGDPALGPSSIMQQFGLSRPALYRLFEPLGGVARYITERRLHRAFRTITDTSRPPPRISQLAYEAGFSSTSAFGRAFRDLFALTPRDARNLAWRSIPDSKLPQSMSEILERFGQSDEE